MERVLNMVLRRLVNMGVNFGVKTVSNRVRKPGNDSSDAGAPSTQSPKTGGGLRQATRMLRRMTRF